MKKKSSQAMIEITEELPISEAVQKIIDRVEQIIFFLAIILAGILYVHFYLGHGMFGTAG